MKMKIEYEDILEVVNLIVDRPENKKDIDLLKWELMAYCLDLKFTAISEGICMMSDGFKWHHC